MHNKHKRRIAMPSEGFEHAVPTIEGKQVYALDGMANLTGHTRCPKSNNLPDYLCLKESAVLQMHILHL